jgi:3-phosphoshikimate 1-carboxyvinyltransferase
VFEWDGNLKPLSTSNIQIPTYHDHRMALAFAPIALHGYSLVIENPDVVVKSYPNYWNDLKSVGFEISEVE